MRNVICIVLFLLVLTSHARAAELPEDLTDALPDQAAEWLEEIPEDDFAGGVTGILAQMGNEAGDIVHQRVRGAAGVLVVVVLCGILEGAFQGIGGKPSPFLPMVGALSVTLLTAGSLDSLMGLGASTIEDLSVFSRALLPTLAAATAASGSVTTATVQQVTTVFLVDVLVSLIRGLLVPLVYVYVGVLAASAALSESRLGVLAEGLKKAVTWCLTTALVLWFLYAGYLLLRGMDLSPDRRARLCAVVGIAAFLDVPLVFLSARLWRSIHPAVFAARGGGLEPEMRTTIFACLIAFGLLWAALLGLRTVQLRQAARLRALNLARAERL